MIDPRHLTVEQWTDAVNLIVATSAPVTVLRGNNWKEWAYNTIAIPSVAAFSPPDPSFDADWLTWAERFVECVLL
jgi:hypothetical protein